jgi:UDP-2-acetamido-3-amino-2,3-dideoxy-glucuronate N-acetyltransferase
MQSEMGTTVQPVPQVAVIGSGSWGKNLVRNFHGHGALRLVCDRDTATLAVIEQQYSGCRTCTSFDQVLNDASIQAVAIAAPAEAHADLVQQALQADKDVFVEKPLCLSVPQGEALVRLARQRKRILMVGHLLWYHPAILRLKQLVADGELGRIEYIYSNRLNLGKFRREENILWSFAPHDISVILGILGEMPSAVQAQAGSYLHPEIADVTVSLLSFPSGVKAHIFVSWLHPFKEQKLIIVGDRSMVVFDDLAEEKLLLYPHSVVWKNQIPVANKAQHQAIPFDKEEPLRAECGHFLDCVITRRQPRTDGEEGLRVLRVLQQCQLALEGKSTTQSVRPDKDYFAHDSAFIDDGVSIGAGTSIWHVSHVMKGSRIGKDCKIGQNVVIGPGVTIGDGVKIQNNVSVYQGVTLEDHVFCGPSMVFTNVFNPRSEIRRMEELRPTLVKKGATLGANCTIVCGVTVGQYAFVGAGAVVTRDIPDYALAVGSPARIKEWVCECGLKLSWVDKEARCECGKQYAKGRGVVRRLEENAVVKGQD